MKFHPTRLNGLTVVELETFRDGRGFLKETFRRDVYEAVGISEDFVQENHSFSSRGVLRGLHFRPERPQAQIVTVLEGHVFDVAVDIRTDSPTFGEWFSVELEPNGRQQIYMAAGFAHGFCVLSESAHLHYKVSETFDASDDAGILWNDPDLKIPWPISDPVLSARDQNHPTFARQRDSMGKRDGK